MGDTSGVVHKIRSGVFDGEVMTDFIDTVEETKMPYLDVLIPQFYADGTPYPYTYVGHAHFLLHPLKKGAKVKVEFYEENVFFPILHSVEDDVLIEDWVEFESPEDGDIVSFPEKSKTFKYEIYDKNNYILWQDDSIITHTEDTVSFQTNDSKIEFVKEVRSVLADRIIEEVMTSRDVRSHGTDNLEVDGDTTILRKGKTDITENQDRTYKNNANVTEEVVGNHSMKSANTDIESMAPVGIKGTQTLLGAGVLQPYLAAETAAWNLYPVIIPPTPLPPGTPVPPAPPLMNMALNGIKAALIAAEAAAMAAAALSVK